MAFNLCLAQVRYPEGGDVTSHAAEYFLRAHERGCDLLVFPENLMTGVGMDRDEFVESAQSLDGPFVREMLRLAKAARTWCVFTVNERREDGRLPYNTAVVADDLGEVCAVYRKAHLFDAGSHRESLMMSPGNKLFEPVQTPFCRLGVGICYDLRFPEYARYEALAGCDLMVYPAAWVAGELKAHHWRTLLTARAIENECYVAGCCCCDDGRIGQSCIVAPDGVVTAAAGTGEELLCGSVDLGRVSSVRHAIPVLEHRRDDLY